jgi:D-sedoheptulose 7-phosphate isomerase
MTARRTAVTDHLRELSNALTRFEESADVLVDWGAQLAWTLTHGNKVITMGNGGSAAEAQHLAGELVGRMAGERMALPAMALTADGVTLSALGNDYGFEQVFARQLRAHLNPGDIVIALSTSGASPNLLAAADTAAAIGATTWALTGPLPNPLAIRCERFIAVDCPDAQIVQEIHQVAVHALCGCVDSQIAAAAGGQQHLSPLVQEARP